MATERKTPFTEEEIENALRDGPIPPGESAEFMLELAANERRKAREQGDVYAKMAAAQYGTEIYLRVLAGQLPTDMRNPAKITELHFKQQAEAAEKKIPRRGA